eukprot:PhM_4_TR2584/c0_g2_i1/m.59481
MSANNHVPLAANMDEAYHALDLARRNYSMLNYPNAIRLAHKSIALYPTAEARQLLEEIQRRMSASSTPTTNSSSATTPSPSAHLSGFRDVLANWLRKVCLYMEHELGIARQYHIPIIVIYTMIACALVWRNLGYGPLTLPWLPGLRYMLL